MIMTWLLDLIYTDLFLRVRCFFDNLMSTGRSLLPSNTMSCEGPGLTTCGAFIVGDTATGAIVVGVKTIRDFILGVKSIGDFKIGVKSIGDFIVGVATAGVFIVGVLTAGVFIVGVLTAGVFIVGVLTAGVFIVWVLTAGAFIVGVIIIGTFIAWCSVTGGTSPGAIITEAPPTGAWTTADGTTVEDRTTVASSTWPVSTVCPGSDAIEPFEIWVSSLTTCGGCGTICCVSLIGSIAVTGEGVHWVMVREGPTVSVLVAWDLAGWRLVGCVLLLGVLTLACGIRYSGKICLCGVTCTI